MKTITSSTTTIQKFLTIIAFGLLSLSANSTGNHDSIQAIVNPAAKINQVSFTALANNNKAELVWTAAPGVKISHFVIEKSTDGINYHDAAVVFAFEDAATTIDYKYADKLNNNQADVVYYRICVIAENGKADYSDIRIIRNANQTGTTKN